MSRDRANAQLIARDLIAEIASEWKPTDTSFCVERDGYYVFEFVLEPVRYARVVKSPLEFTSSPDSVVFFNPYREATEIVFEFIEKVRTLGIVASMGAEECDWLIRRDSKTAIRQMLKAAPETFRDAIWQTRIISGTLQGVDLMQAFEQPNRARTMIKNALDVIQNRLKTRLGTIPGTRTPRITRFKVNTAVATFFPQFKKTREIPSQRRFATELGVTAKAWRSYLEKNDLDAHDSYVRERFERMLTEQR